MTNPIWDLPTRLFHWLLVIAVCGAVASGFLEAYEVHEAFGLSVLALLLFRVGWGCWGSVHSRFRDFLPTPARLLQYLRHGGDRAGHNPLGGLSILVMLTLLLAQVISGLVNGEDFGYQAPWRPAVSEKFAGILGEYHELGAWLIITLVALHLAAVLWHEWRHQRRVVRAMISGRRPPLHGSAAAASGWRALLTVAVAFGLVCLLLWLAPEPVSYAW